jgi:hypothetical protein
MYDEKHKSWVGGRAIFTARGIEIENAGRDAAAAHERRHAEFLLPPTSSDADVAIVRCASEDSNGDPIGIVDPRARPNFGIIRRDGLFYLVAVPNQKDQKAGISSQALASRNTFSRQASTYS